MKEEILDITKKLYDNHLTPETATNLLLDLFAVSGRSEQFKCGKCSSNWGELRAICFNCGHESEDLST